MKKSIFLFILWGAATFILTNIYLALMMNSPIAQNSMIGWILLLCTAIMSLAMMALIHSNAKIEQVTWLKIVSKVLLIFYSAVAAAGVLLFALSRLVV